jgi:type IV secretory pathway VirB10-like protein
MAEQNRGTNRRNFILAGVAAIGGVTAWLLFGRKDDDAPPVVTGTPTATTTPTNTPEPTTNTPTPTPTSTSTPPDTPTPTDTPTNTPVPDTPEPAATFTPEVEVATQHFDVYDCSYVGNHQFEWYEAEVTYHDGVPVEVEILSGPHTGPWQPGCPVDPDEGNDGKSGGGDGNGGGGGGGSQSDNSDFSDD